MQSSRKVLIFLIMNFIAERLEKEVCGLLPPCMNNGIRVLPPPYGVDSAWYGAKLIGNVSYPF
uniref:Actin, macronuclear n=1 Tax=Solanum tuberosum TaxID=4113 RepID=M1C058_SOLTU